MKGEDMADLKKCPFCGGEAKICDGSNDIVGSQYEIRCKEINCAIRPKTEWHISLEEAISHWNNRATEAEIRAKGIDEFAERMKERIVGMQMAELQGEDICPCTETGEECPYINQDIGCQYCAREYTIKDIDEIAKQMKEGGKDA